MLEPRLEFVSCASPAGLHRMAYWEWGDPECDEVVLCVHGLTRSGRDFDHLARRLSKRFRVVCPDIAGRGRSDWLLDPSLYTVPQYVADMITLIARLRPRKLNWVGTSMGGLIGLGVSGTAAFARIMATMNPRPGALPPDQGIRLDKLVLNDVGPKLEVAALARIGQYVGAPGEFDTFEAAVTSMRENSTSFGEHTDEQWIELARFLYPEQHGKWVKHYDLNLAQPMEAQTPEDLEMGEQMLWQAYDSVDCPILIVRGALSDLLTPTTVQEMLKRNPNASAIEIPKVGHAPTLISEEQIAPVEEFLLK